MVLKQSILSKKGRILIVDDQPENLDLLEEILTGEGYAVTRASDGIRALEEIEKEFPDCIILDIMMPHMDGYSVCRKLKSSRRSCFIPIIMLTALSEISDKVKGLEAGADDFLNKPLHGPELLARVRSLVRIKLLRDELDSSENIILSMVQALEMKDPVSAGHSERVATQAARLAKRLALPPSEIETVARGAILHDIGKIGIPEKILWPASRRTPLEEEVFRMHPEMGKQILSPLSSFAPVNDIILHHHERLDGSGYPHGLRGEDFALPVEIAALCNCFDIFLQAGLDKEEAASRIKGLAQKGEFHADLAEELILDLSGAESPAQSWQELLPIPAASPSGRILIGDDTPSNREILEEILTDAGHSVVCEASGEALLLSLDEVKPDLVLVDIRMAWMDGFEVCASIKAQPETEFLPVILVTAYREMKDRIHGANVGADDFLLLPINRMELLSRIKSLLRLRFYLQDLEKHQNVILSLASALEAKDPYTHGHSERVGVLASQLARELGFTSFECELMKIAGRLHDIGKIGIPENLLNKPAKLSEEEMRAIQAHPTRGELICQRLVALKAVLPTIRHHHEHYAGNGYPDGLKGDAIPLEARILGIADAYDAMTSNRSYRGAMTAEAALGILKNETEDGQWDSRIYSVFAQMIQR